MLFYKQEFIKLSQLAKNQEKSKQHPEADILLLKTFSLSSSSLSSKNNRRYSKKCAKKQDHLFEWGYD